MSTPKTFDYTQSSKDLKSKYKKQPSKKELKQSTKKAAEEIGKLGLAPSISAHSKFTSLKNIAEQVEGLKSAGTGVLSNLPSAQQSFSSTPISQSQSNVWNAFSKPEMKEKPEIKGKDAKSPVEKNNQMGGGPNAWDPSLAAKSIVEKESAAEKKGPLYKSGNPLSKYGGCRK